MTTRTLGGLAFLLLFSTITMPATRPQSIDESKKARQSVISAREHPNKQGTKDESSKQEPRDGAEWYGRAYEHHSADRYPEAIEAFKRAADLDFRKATSMYNIACGYSLLNDKDNALAWLQRAFDSGFSSADLLASDSDLDPLRTDLRFKKILTSMPVDENHSRRGKGKGYLKDRLEETNVDFARLERTASADGNEWARVGMRLLLLRELDRSIVALKQGVDLLGDRGSSAMYNLACAYSLKGDRDTGIQWLETSVNSGFDEPDKLRNDPDIKNLRGDSRFLQIEKLSDTLSLSQFDKPEGSYDHSEHSQYSKERWAPAIQLYESFVRTQPRNGRAWSNLGLALHYSYEHTRAISAWQRALELGYRKSTSSYNLACAYAMLNQRDAAFEWLDRAITAGFDSYGHMNSDRDLDNLRSDPRFRRFIDRAKNQKHNSREMSWHHGNHR